MFGSKIRHATDLSTLLKEIQEKDRTILALRQQLEDLRKVNQKLNSQNIELILQNKSKDEEVDQNQKRSINSETVERQKYETMLQEYKQIKEQQRKKQIGSYENLISQQISSIQRYKDLAKMWQQRCSEQRKSVEQSKQHAHELIVIFGNKKILIGQICKALQKYFNEKVSESEILARINSLINQAVDGQPQGHVIANILNQIDQHL